MEAGRAPRQGEAVHAVIHVLQGSRFLRERAGLPVAQRAEVDAALRQLPAAFGQIHVHAGLGIRRLRRNWFECRAGLHLRVVFFVEGDECRCYTVGNHEHVRRFLRST